ncbi:MAG: Uma2 family endonuclease [Merismopedia sp. SIO2A8]|nr:Uma2 family endonuclease [Merismopedia sp. SIO2A8]
MVQTASTSITLDTFLAQPETKPAYEFVDGTITQKPMPQGQHSTLQGELVSAINAITKPSRLAWAFPELRCTFGDRSIVPDITVFTWTRLPTNDDGTIANQFMTYPDWTIEILSPNQSSTRVISNLLHCLDHGTQLGWLMDPNERLIFTYAPNQQPQVFDHGDDRLPVPTFATDLHLTLAQVWNWLRVN